MKSVCDINQDMVYLW